MDNKILRENTVGLLILAGGSSRRMGKDKASLTIEGRTFLEYIEGGMGEFEEKLFSTNGSPVPSGFESVQDLHEVKEMGPAAGILSALEICKSRWLMVVPCDAPFIDRRVFSSLWEKAMEMASTGEASIPVLARGTGGVEPLIGLYPKEAAEEIRKSLDVGIKKVIDILERAGFETVKIDDEKLLNVNSPQDYETIGKRYE